MSVLYKAQPDPRSVHVDTVLTNISIAYLRDQPFRAAEIFPIVRVNKQSDRYFVYTKQDWLKARATKIAPASETPGAGYTLSTDTYFADVWGFHKDVDDMTRANADTPIDPDVDATEFVTHTILLTREKEWVTRYFTTGVWGTDYQGVASNPSGNQFLQWNDAASDPVKDVRRARLQIQGTTGLRPNTFVCSRVVYEYLTEHPIVVDRVKYTQRALGEDLDSTEVVARLFKVQRVIVLDAVESDDAGNVNWVAGKHAWLGYVAPRPGLLRPSAGYIFSWRFAGGDAQVVMTRFRMEHIRSDRIEGLASWDMKVVAPDLGAFFQNAVA